MEQIPCLKSHMPDRLASLQICRLFMELEISILCSHEPPLGVSRPRKNESTPSHCSF